MDFSFFRDELGDRTLIRTVQEDIGLQGREKHLLVVQGLEQYNKVCEYFAILIGDSDLALRL